jgi:DNA processing protein
MEQYWEWLCSTPGLYRVQIEVLLRCFRSPEAVFRASTRELEHLEEKGCIWIDKVRSHQKGMLPEDLVHTHRAEGIQFISCMQEGYPMRLQRIDNRPYGLFFKGRLPEETKKSIAVVGARKCSRFGREMAQLLAGQIAAMGGVVVSGAAYGIDGAAQWSALQSGGESYAVLGCGADRVYPASNRALLERLYGQGGVISEYPPGTPPLSSHFPLRNRIISALADVVVVVEARKRSGSLITADYAAEQGKTVLAVPGRPGEALSEGCNELIEQGAGIITSLDTFSRQIFPEKLKKRKSLREVGLAPAEKLVYSNVDLTSKSLWELEEGTALSLSELGNALITLEGKGLIKETERNRYARTN